MAPVTDDFDLGGLRLGAGEGRSLALEVHIAPLQLGSERYSAEPERVPVALDVSRMMGGGYALRLRFDARVLGPCMRCLKPAEPTVEVDSREVDAANGEHGAGDGDELDSPYLHGEILDLSGWARDTFALAMPVKILCRPACLGLCPVCAVDLNEAPSEHHHETAPDPRWAKLGELKLE